MYKIVYGTVDFDPSVFFISSRKTNNLRTSYTAAKTEGGKQY